MNDELTYVFYIYTRQNTRCINKSLWRIRMYTVIYPTHSIHSNYPNNGLHTCILS